MESFELWCYRRMMNIKWMDRITNEEVLGRIGERRTLWKSLRKKRGQMMGHALRHGGLLRDILQGEVGKKRKAQIKIFRPNNWAYGMGDIERGQTPGGGQRRVESGYVKPVLGLCTR